MMTAPTTQAALANQNMCGIGLYHLENGAPKLYLVQLNMFNANDRVNTNDSW